MNTFWLNGEGPPNAPSPNHRRKSSDCCEKSLRPGIETAECKQPMVEATIVTSIPARAHPTETGSNGSVSNQLHGQPGVLQQLQYPVYTVESFRA